MAVCGRTRSKVTCRRLLECGQLIPGLPNELVVEHIASRVPWMSTRILASVSRGWFREIQTREVYRARVRSHSTEDFVLISYNDPNNWICLYSVQDSLCVDLPPIPNQGFPFSCQCAALDGKVYVIGGLTKGDPNDSSVFVLDLAGQGGWRRCAPMNYARAEFGCGVLQGKIYVFGGSFFGAINSEVYDPVEDVWTPIRAMQLFSRNNPVHALGEDFFILGGDFSDSIISSSRPSRNAFRRIKFFGVFNPIKDEWREMQRDSDEVLFTSQGRLYSMTKWGIHVVDAPGGSRLPFQRNYFDIFDPGDVKVCPVAVLAVGEELLAIMSVNPSEGWAPSKWYHLLRSTGFGKRSCEVVWKDARGFDDDDLYVIEWEKFRSRQPSPGFPGQLKRDVLFPIGL